MSHTTRGKWSLKGIPHKGWFYVDTFDLGEPLEICEMCKSQEIRYVHVVGHPDYVGTLDVGCVCCENLTQDYVNPGLREDELRRKAGQQKRKPVLAYTPILRSPLIRPAGSLPSPWFWTPERWIRAIVDDSEITVLRNGRTMWESRLRRLSDPVWMYMSWGFPTVEEVVKLALDEAVKRIADGK